MSTCETDDCKAVEKVVREYMDDHANEVRWSVLEDQVNLDVMIRLQLKPVKEHRISGHDIDLPLSESIKQEILKWLNETLDLGREHQSAVSHG